MAIGLPFKIKQSLMCNGNQDGLIGTFEGNTLMGYAWFGHDNKSDTLLNGILKRRAGEIRHLYVEPDHQGKGIGKLLFNHAVTNLRQSGHNRMRLFTEASNSEAIGFYEKLDGTTNGKTVGRDYHGEDMMEYNWNI